MCEAGRDSGQRLEFRSIVRIHSTRHIGPFEARPGAVIPRGVVARSTRALLSVVVAAALTACGGAATSVVKVTSPFSARDAELFDDAADYLTDPAGLQGAWAESWSRDVDDRTKGANVVAIVKVTTIVSDVDLAQHKGIRLVPEVSRPLKGTLPADTGLRVSEGRPGYVSVDSNRSQLMADEYVLFLKWYDTPDKTVAAHWHLAPASPPVIERIEKALGTGAPTKSHIVIHKD